MILPSQNTICLSLRLLGVALATMLVQCRDIEEPDLFTLLVGGSGGNRLGVITSDLGSAGRFSTMTLDGVPTVSFTNVHSDAVARYQDGRVYVINRFKRDNIQVLNPGVFYLTELEFSVEAGSNPHDFVRLNANRAYVTRYEKTTMRIVNPTIGTTVGEIDLSAFADTDGIPEMSGMHLDGNRLYVAVQRLDRNSAVSNFPPTDRSLLVQIDTNIDAPVNSFQLPATNPFSKLRPAQLFGQAHIVVATPGGIGSSFGADGGVSAFNLDNQTMRGIIYSEAVAGGDILDVAIKNDTTGYAVVMASDLSVTLQRFDPLTGQRLADLAYYPSSGGFVAGLVIGPTGYLYVGDASFQQPGISIYDTNANDRLLTPTPVSVGLRPTDLVYIPIE